MAHAVPTVFNVPQDSVQIREGLGKNGEDNSPIPFHTWINECEFRCLECLPEMQQFNDQETFEIHVHTTHFMGITHYMKKHRLQEISSVELHFQCPMCSPSDIGKWTLRSLERHAMIGHQMGLKQLYDIAHGPSKDIPVVLLSKNATKRPRSPSYGLRLPKRTTDSRHWDIVESSIEETHKDSRDVPDSKANPDDKSGNMECFMSLTDKGELKCQECKVVFCDEAGITGHMSLVHQMDVTPYMRKHEVKICEALETTEQSSLHQNYENLDMKTEKGYLPELNQEIEGEDDVILGP